MSRVQLALNVDDVDAAVAFYSALFAAEPAKRRPGYANFALDEPALKLVLIENPGKGGSVNHLGLEVASTEIVDAEQRRLAGVGLASVDERGTTCCYAVQDKFWVQGAPDGERWEVYTVLADAGAELEGRTQRDRHAPLAANDGACCTPQATAVDDRPASGTTCCA
ncbi:MAG: ArsI/CadI family heavy metal resistance metalloenzyme [Kineosporiaceae bacterium]